MATSLKSVIFALNISAERLFLMEDFFIMNITQEMTEKRMF
jgi:hypothetical protein